jgi:hypothetical protein
MVENKMTTEEQKLEILKKVEQGTVSVEEGSDLLGKLESSEEPKTTEDHAEKTNKKVEASGCWRAAWSIFLVIGALLSGFSGYWMSLGYKNHGLGWGFWLSWIPMIVGLVIIVFGWALMDSPWINVHVRTKNNENSKDYIFIFSMPVPFNLARWTVDHFGQYFSDKVKPEEILEVINQAEESIRKGDPFHIEVDETKDGSHVDVSIN